MAAIIPPEPAPTPPTDCQRFADRVAEIASGHNNVRGFLDELARTFIGVASSNINVMRRNANTSTGSISPPRGSETVSLMTLEIIKQDILWED